MLGRSGHLPTSFFVRQQQDVVVLPEAGVDAIHFRQARLELQHEGDVLEKIEEARAWLENLRPEREGPVFAPRTLDQV